MEGKEPNESVAPDLATIGCGYLLGIVLGLAGLAAGVVFAVILWITVMRSPLASRLTGVLGSQLAELFGLLVFTLCLVLTAGVTDRLVRLAAAIVVVRNASSNAFLVRTVKYALVQGPLRPLIRK